MNAERLAFLEAICTDKADDTVRLVYADWLDEHGEPERAEFIRVQVGLARLLTPEGKCPKCGDSGGPCDAYELTPIGTLRRRERELLERSGAHWLPKILPGGYHHAVTSPGVIGVAHDDFRGGFEFARGFVSHITCTAENWLAHADALCWHPDQKRPFVPTAQPLEKVKLTTSDERLGWFRNDGDRWRSEWWRNTRWPGILFDLPPVPLNTTRATAGEEIRAGQLVGIDENGRVVVWRPGPNPVARAIPFQ